MSLNERHAPPRERRKPIPDYLAGGWYVFPLRRKGYNRRPHYYVDGSDKSLCENAPREEGMLEFDRERGISLQTDPLLGRIQTMRRACLTCDELLAEPETTADIVNRYVIGWAPRG